MTRRWLLAACLFLLPFSTQLADDPPIVPAPRAPGARIGPVSPAPPQAPDSIYFDEHRITLGMPQEQVLKLVGESYRVEHQQDGLWWVHDKLAGGTIGDLYFSKGVLIEATRDWEPVEPAAGPAVQTMDTAFAAMRQMVPGTLRSCKVYPDRLSTQTGFAVSCEPMLVQIFMTKNEGEPIRVFVHQVLGSRVESTPSAR